MPDLPAPIAMIGARAEKLARLDPAWVALYTRIAVAAARAGREVRTGAATGADQVAAEAALEAGGRVRLYLPNDGHEASWRRSVEARYPGQVSSVVYAPGEYPCWEGLVRTVHPNPAALGRGSAFRLMCRNVGIIESASCVIALPLWEGAGEQRRAGGTEFGMRLARHLGIRLWDLSEEDAREHWERRLG